MDNDSRRQWRQYRFTAGDDHWLRGAARTPSPHADDRPAPADISLVVVHGISLPPGRFGTGMVERFFQGSLDVGEVPALAELAGARVSSHLLISRWGRVTQFVPFNRRAWHAGVSAHAGRANCNDYSIGIELEGTDQRPYTNTQYQRLAAVLAALLRRYPKLAPERVVGHADIAPGRKTDPGPHFDWGRLRRALDQAERDRPS